MILPLHRRQTQGVNQFRTRMPITERLRGGHRRLRRWGFAAVSVLVHAGLLAALVVSTDDEAAPEEAEEEVTYVDIRRFAPPPPPAASGQQPEAQQAEPTPRAQPTEPRPQQPRPDPPTPARATDLVDEVDSIPEDPLGADLPSEPLAPRVERSVSGSVSASSDAAGGQAGGVAGGVEGGRAGGVVGGQGEEIPDPGGTYIASVVDRQAELSNRRDLPRLMRRLYPDVLRDAGIGGRVVVQFVVDTNGRVDMSTIKVMSASHDGFVDATRQALREFRFRPARVGDRTVRMLTQLPIDWEVAG